MNANWATPTVFFFTYLNNPSILGLAYKNRGSFSYNTIATRGKPQIANRSATSTNPFPFWLFALFIMHTANSQVFHPLSWPVCCPISVIQTYVELSSSFHSLSLYLSSQFELCCLCCESLVAAIFRSIKYDKFSHLFASKNLFIIQAELWQRNRKST